MKSESPELYFNKVTSLRVNSDMMKELWKSGVFKKSKCLKFLKVIVRFNVNVSSLGEALKDWTKFNSELSTNEQNTQKLLLVLARDRRVKWPALKKALGEIVNIVVENKSDWYISLSTDGSIFTPGVSDLCLKLLNEVQAARKVGFYFSHSDEDLFMLDLLKSVSKINKLSLTNCPTPLEELDFSFDNIPKLSLLRCTYKNLFLKSRPDTLKENRWTPLFCPHI
ncbi:unnamed protein product [Ambrosiozyma monospora]|uniref:Unnamed protein product n=1 Tax=Ambrosiozyma monospora TaxID=43982 RepID=A0ACB5SVK1_AMBMO|nr:unnamed protein product [Ambrosiozyma monospora]